MDQNQTIEALKFKIQNALYRKIGKVLSHEDVADIIRQCLRDRVKSVQDSSVEIVEESEEMKIVRKIMEEEQDEFVLNLKVQFESPLEYVTLQIPVKSED